MITSSQLLFFFNAIFLIYNLLIIKNYSGRENGHTTTGKPSQTKSERGDITERASLGVKIEINPRYGG